MKVHEPKSIMFWGEYFHKECKNVFANILRSKGKKNVWNAISLDHFVDSILIDSEWGMGGGSDSTKECFNLCNKTAIIYVGIILCINRGINCTKIK